MLTADLAFCIANKLTTGQGGHHSNTKAANGSGNN